MTVLFQLLDAVGLFLAGILLLPASVLALQIVASFRARPAHTPSSGPMRIGVLMPAHDEALGIGAAVANVLAQLEAGDRLLVVADNCSDDTAALAIAAGAEVVVRHDPNRRGKGYALDHGVRHYERSPVDVVVIVDADCELHPGALRTLAAAARATGRPAQALYLMEAPAGTGAGTRVAEFAMRVRNLARPLGCLALGWPCQLMGTGMAFTWPVIVGAPLASGHLVEDMELGLALAAEGKPPLFCPTARVTSRFSSDAAGTRSQRTRWEHGHLAMIAKRGLPVLWRGVSQRRPALAALALDLCVPPLALLVLAHGAAVCATAVWALLTGSLLPLAVAALGALATSSAIVLAWRRHGRDVLPPHALRAIPGYMLGKLPIYLGWFTRRQTEWVRTERDRPPPK